MKKSKAPANTGGYTPKSFHGEGAGHSNQPSGNSIGTGAKRNWSKLPVMGGTGSMPKAKEVANNGGYVPKSAHVEGAGHANQPRGHSTGEGQGERHSLGQPYQFRQPPARNAHSFGHQGSLKQGALRLSGVKGAHMVGCRKK